MFIDGQRALVITRFDKVKSALCQELPERYNLEVETAGNGMEGIAKIGNRRRPYEIVIIDDRSEGLWTASHLQRLIRRRCPRTTVLYLSTLCEWDTTICLQCQGDIPAKRYLSEFLIERVTSLSRVAQATLRLERLNSLFQLLAGTSEMDCVFRDSCMGLVKIFEADIGVLVLQEQLNSRLNPGVPYDRAVERRCKYRGVLKELFPGNGSVEGNKSDTDFRGVSPLEELVDYLKPVHMPVVSGHKALYDVLSKILGMEYLSVLIVPLVFHERVIGFSGLFTRNKRRIFCLEEMDLYSRFSDILALSIGTWAINSESNRLSD
jgi:hypothetical protein